MVTYALPYIQTAYHVSIAMETRLQFGEDLFEKESFPQLVKNIHEFFRQL